jgi:hypothetical protein
MNDCVGHVMKRRVVINDRMQHGYVYYLTEPMGRNSIPGSSRSSPKQMLRLGVFGGKYMTDCRHEFPAGWFTHARLCRDRHDPHLNYFGVNASQRGDVDCRRQRQAVLHWAYDSRKI